MEGQSRRKMAMGGQALHQSHRLPHDCTDEGSHHPQWPQRQKLIMRSQNGQDVSFKTRTHMHTHRPKRVQSPISFAWDFSC